MKKTLILALFVLALGFLPNQASATSWNAFTIVENLGYGELLIADDSYYYQIDHSYGCSFNSLDEGQTIYLDSFLPSFGTDIYYEDYYDTQTCYVSNFPERLDFTAYTINLNAGSDSVLVSNDNGSYIIDTNYGCSFNSTDDGKTIYIDSLLEPSYGDAVYLPDTTSEFCSVRNFPDELNLYPLQITDSNWTNSTITATNNGASYLIQYGYGCSWSYMTASTDLYVDSNDQTLSTYDTLYNFHYYGYDECSILSVTSISTTGSTSTLNESASVSTEATSTLTSPSKPVNLKAKKRKKRKATLQWNRHNSATYYKLQVRKKNKKIKTFKHVTKRKKVVGKRYLKRNTKYRFRVKACNSAGCSRWSDYKKFKTNK